MRLDYSSQSHGDINFHEIWNSIEMILLRWGGGGGGVKKMYENHIFQCMGKIICVEFQNSAFLVLLIINLIYLKQNWSSAMNIW